MNIHIIFCVIFLIMRNLKIIKKNFKTFFVFKVFYLTFVAQFGILIMETTKDRLITHAATLFANNGCKAITMDDIANSMGISKRTIYENFKDKEALLEACLHYFFEKGKMDTKQILQSSDNILVAIFKLLENTSKMFFQLKLNFFNEVQKYYPEIHNNIVKVFKRQHLESTEKLLQKGIADGIVRKEIIPSIISVLINEVFIMIIQKDVFADYGYDKKTAMHTCMSCITRGMFTEKGMQILDRYMKEYKKMNYDDTI